ncbi:HAD family hydrolase [Streptomyces sp. NPDC059740]|uniref:HAD family hydrolase n=1 Tax=Streptomyces sp. NPDC059740 TaxID=3346926 RepID=UPI003663527D
MTIDAVLFDFSGTLMRVAPVADWLRRALTETGVDMAPAAFDRAVAALDEAGALPGGSTPARLPDHLTELWQVRDVDATRHRQLYTGLARQVELPDEALYNVLYDHHMTPEAWRPYPDAEQVLRTLQERGKRVAVVSNIGWDLRPVLRAHGLERHVDTCVLSYEHGVQKPDPRLFRLACRALSVDPAATVMVGDDRRADGGATALGCGFLPVDHLPVTERPAGLLPVLELVS